MKAHWNRRWGRAILSVLFALSIISPINAPAGASPAGAEIEPAVLEQVTENKEATFWLLLRERADVSAAHSLDDWEARGRHVAGRLQAVANASQAGLRGLLQKRGLNYRPFWIANTIRVTGDRAALEELAARPEVAKIIADKTYAVPEPLPGNTENTILAVEWGLDRIRAPLVWSTFGVRGEGIVVANIDSGVQYDHPALVAQYRGNQGGGSFNHNYNWFDPSHICGYPLAAPCDNTGHGTHTMGTMVGDDGDPGPNQIGVAPHARWIAAKGCETNRCSASGLLAAGEWVLAPTDLSGQNPRPDLRPHIVNNSWGNSDGSDPFYQATVQAWVASGIFPVFANGNGGPGCGTVGAPGSYPESYGVGAFDINNAIAYFSSLGPAPAGVGGQIKPNISAPGVDVRSSVPNNSYAFFSGTSMAAPHLAGTIALIWSAAPTLVGNIASTRALLNQAAIDMPDLTCGGTAGNNNVWGEGRLDAFAAVVQAPRPPTGTLQGTVTDASTGNPIAGARVQAAGPYNRTTMTNANGHYSLPLPVGTYAVTAGKFGYRSQTATGVLISDGQTTTQHFALVAVPAHVVSGHVRDDANQSLANATVAILGTPIAPVSTDANGFYSFAGVPEGTYDLWASADRCITPRSQSLAVDGNETLDFALPHLSDSYGYSCAIATPAWIEAGTVLPLTGFGQAVQISLPFPFTFYGQTYNQAFASTSGFLNFLDLNIWNTRGPIPNEEIPNAAIYPFWDDLVVDASASVRSELLGSAPNRRFVIEWRNVHLLSDATLRLDFEVILHENGHILTQYRNIANDGREQGNSATLGIENETGTVALQYSFAEATVGTPEFAVLYDLPPSGFVQGHVTDANDGLGVVGATVRALQGGSTVRQVTTDADGFYRMQLPLGTYLVEASARNYATRSAAVEINVENAVVTRDFSLDTARAEVAPTSLEFIVPPNQTQSKLLTLRNTANSNASWEIHELAGGGMSTGSAPHLQRNPGYDSTSRTTEGLYIGQKPLGWAPTAPGRVIRSWTPSGLFVPWGVGYAGNVWLSDPTNADGLCGGPFAHPCHNVEFTVLGAATGRDWPAPWAADYDEWNADMAYDAARGLMCQVKVGGNNGIYCWDPDTGIVADSIISGPWRGTSQRGLAYRPDDDTFYIGGWNEGILYHIKGLSYPDKGAVIGQCSPPDENIAGLAWNADFGIVWEATNSQTDTIYALDPDTCAVLQTLPHPDPGSNGGGLEMDEVGNLWMVSQFAAKAYLVESSVPAFTDIPWLSEAPTSGTLGPGGTQNIRVTVNAAGLAPGVYNTTLLIRSNSGRRPLLPVPVNLVVYQQGVNAGSGAYTDLAGHTWAADQPFATGSWGYTNRNSPAFSTRRGIGGTEDDPLYQHQRQNPDEYRFDGLPTGVYQVELRFAELTNRAPNTRIFDVLIEGNVVLPAYDIAKEVGTFMADDHTFFIRVTDGQLNIGFVPRRGQPAINAIRVTPRPDE